MEELAPNLLGPVHQTGANAMVHDLEEPPVPAGLRNLAKCGGSQMIVVQALEVNDWDVGMGGLIRIGEDWGWSLGWGLDVSVWKHTGLGQGLDPDYWLWPIRRAVHGVFVVSASKV